MDRVYLDTSVFGGYFEPEFELYTKILFDKIINGKLKIIYSRLTDIELNPAPSKVRDLVKIIPKQSMEVIETSQAALELASIYTRKSGGQN
ncbi:hypothetical protein I5M32_00250 [Pedobacter sp. SD-b]|uniref:PIN domain-containing protein n=1 Tax=Pedobacter segetis TaxID=2793069 RepID=A0ABS1BET7_9SPHI|nr:hypothetical protein [Pedobacter segetis]MBK0381374.1 hypothetical protein [Pedobacter segetis]